MTRSLGFTAKAWAQMWRLTQECPTEISAMGLLHPTNDCIVQEFFVPKQRCDATYTEMDDESYAALCAKLSASGVDISRLRVFWHSHVNMGTGPSGTDLKTFERLSNGAFLWSIITNKTGAGKALFGADPGDGVYVRLDLYDPVDHTKNDSIYRVTVEKCRCYVILSGLVGNTWIKEALGNVSPYVRTVTPTINLYPGQHLGEGGTWDYNTYSTRLENLRKGKVPQTAIPAREMVVPQPTKETVNLSYWEKRWLYS